MRSLNCREYITPCLKLGLINCKASLEVVRWRVLTLGAGFVKVGSAHLTPGVSMSIMEPVGSGSVTKEKSSKR